MRPYPARQSWKRARLPRGPEPPAVRVCADDDGPGTREPGPVGALSPASW
ncbi:hypothetical protein [Streptomyces sp. NPDC047803]